MVEVQADHSIMPLPKLRFDPDWFRDAIRVYDKKRDVLFGYRPPKRAAISYDVAGQLWVRFDPKSGEVVGFEFEDFEKVFLAKHPELRLGWQEIKPRITKKFKRNGSLDAYLRVLMQFISQMIESNPSQLRMMPT